MPEKFIKPVVIIGAISILSWMLLWITYRILKRKDAVKIPVRTVSIFFLFYLYIVGVLSLTILPLPFTRFKTATEKGINITPVVNIVKGLLEMFSSEVALSAHSFQNIFGNIILFIPLGIFLPLISTKYRFINNVAILACVCSVSIELTQLLLRQFEIYRSVDINDVIINTTGAVLGFLSINRFYFKRH